MIHLQRNIMTTSKLPHLLKCMEEFGVVVFSTIGRKYQGSPIPGLCGKSMYCSVNDSQSAFSPAMTKGWHYPTSSLEPTLCCLLALSGFLLSTDR